MNSDLKEIEQTLYELKPAKLPDELSSQIEEIFKNSEQNHSTHINDRKIVWLPIIQKVSAAAALLIACIGVFFAMLNDQNSSNKTTSSKASANEPLKKNQFIPVNAKNVFEGVQDEGLFLSNSQMRFFGRMKKTVH